MEKKDERLESKEKKNIWMEYNKRIGAVVRPLFVHRCITSFVKSSSIIIDNSKIFGLSPKKIESTTYKC